MKAIDFVIQRTSVKHLEDRAIIALRFEKRIYQSVSFR